MLQYLNIGSAKLKCSVELDIRIITGGQCIAECRNDWIEKETKRLVSKYQIIGVEDLNLKGMMKFSRNAKNYGDASWGTFVNKLLWKASKNEHNCQVVKADRFFASSQICHCCGYKNPLTKNLSVRKDLSELRSGAYP